MASLTLGLLGAAALIKAKQKHKTPRAPGSDAYASLLGDAPDTTADTAQAYSASVAAAALQRRKAAGGTGRASTLLTGPQGVTNSAPLARNTLLGS